MSELYVYYKLKAERAEAAHTAFVRACGEASVRLLQRQDDAELLTWMEVHSPEQQDLELRIASAMAPFIEGIRHHERFEPLIE